MGLNNVDRIGAFTEEFIRLCHKYGASPEWSCHTEGVVVKVNLSARLSDTDAVNELQENLSPTKILKTRKKGKKNG